MKPVNQEQINKAHDKFAAMTEDEKVKEFGPVVSEIPNRMRPQFIERLFNDSSATEVFLSGALFGLLVGQEAA